MPRRDRPPRGLDAELAQLLEDPASVGYRPLKARPPRRPRSARVRRVRAVGLPSPVFFGLLALTAAGGAVAAVEPFDSVAARVGVFVFVLAGWLVSVCLHEFAHAYVAYRGGDDNVIGADYLRLNPFRYVHPFLSLVLPLVWIAYGGIGLPGGAVLIHRHQLRSRVWASAVSAAGPLTNVIVALVSVLGVHILKPQVTSIGSDGVALYAGLAWFAWLQVSVVILNLLPVPGLDGWGILEPWLSPETARSVDKIRPFGLLIVVALLWVPRISDAFSTLVGQIASWIGDSQDLAYFGQELFKFWQH